MDIEALEKSLNQELKPIYTFVGDQPFLQEMLLESLREKVMVGPFADMNYNLFHADEKGAVEKALETIEQLPMMAGKRLVIIREGEKIKNKALIERLADYLNNANTFCCLALCFANLAKNSKIWKRSQKFGVALAFDRIYEREMPFWVNRMALKQGKKISRDAMNFLVRSVGADLAKANSEVEKAALHAGLEKTIEVENVEAVLASVKAESIFDMMDAIGKRNIPETLYLIKRMLDAGEQPLRILFQIGNHMKRLMMVRSLLVEQVPVQQIGRVLGVMDFLRDKLIAQAKVFPRRELRLSLVIITKADFELKNGRISDRAVLEKLILDLCRVQPRKGRAV